MTDHPTDVAVGETWTDTGGTGDEWRCALTYTALGWDDANDYGVVPSEFAATVEGVYRPMLVEPDGTERPMTIRVARVGLPATVESEFVGDPGGISELPCRDFLSVPIAVSVETDDGALAERWTAEQRFETAPYGTEPDTERLWLWFGAPPEEMRGTWDFSAIDTTGHTDVHVQIDGAVEDGRAGGTLSLRGRQGTLHTTVVTLGQW